MTWTGAFRDPRFSPPADGGRPENALTGTIYTVGAFSERAIRVPGEFKPLRFWRNTSVASLDLSGTVELPMGTLGYEWNEDMDNGFRPAGLFWLSTSHYPGVVRVRDYGNTVDFDSSGSTHHMTL